MGDVTYDLKGRISQFKARSETVEIVIQDEFTTESDAFWCGRKALKDALKLLTHSHDSWRGIGISYKKFADLISNDAGVNRIVSPHAEEAVKAANAVHFKLEAPPEPSKSLARLITRIRAYLFDLEAVHKQSVEVLVSSVELGFCKEKCLKLAKKAERAIQKGKLTHKVSDKTNHELDMYEIARNDYMNERASVTEILKRSNAKCETMLHCAHAAYWLQQDEFLKFIMEKTADARGKADEHKDELVNYDMGVNL